MSEVRLPIKTIRNGNEITKICVEDVYKILNRVIEQIDKTDEKVTNIMDSVDKTVDGYTGSLIVGRGVSKPVDGEEFDEQVGNNIAFMKSKLNANMKKYNLINRVYKEYEKLLNFIDIELDNIEYYINMDLKGIRKYNPDYLKA